MSPKIQRSKSLSPAHYGESREDPARSVLLLRAWMLCRARQNGWVDWDRGRKLHFAEEAIVLERKIAALEKRPKGNLLGNAQAARRAADPAPALRLRSGRLRGRTSLLHAGTSSIALQCTHCNL